MNQCIYCKQEGKLKLNETTWCCSQSRNSCPARRKKNSDGLKKAIANGKINISNHCFTDKDRQKVIDNKKSLVVADLKKDGIFRSNHYLRKIIQEYSLLEYHCAKCSITTWNNAPITLDLDHIDGNSHNCKLENLRWLCPNCHSQTSTFRGKNINTGKIKVSDEILLDALRQNVNIRQALISVGLAPKGGNYNRALKLRSKIEKDEM